VGTGHNVKYGQSGINRLDRYFPLVYNFNSWLKYTYLALIFAQRQAVFSNGLRKLVKGGAA
jgi:hypothetical protein